MKSILALILILGFLSCNNINPVAGKWKIESIGTEDTASAHKNLLGFALLTMVSSGAEWEFLKDGKYIITYNEKTPYANGNYVLTNNNLLILHSENESDTCELLLKSDHQIQIKFSKSSSIINLTKK